MLYQLQLLLEEYDQYCQNKYLPNIHATEQNYQETATKILDRLRNQILNYLRAYGVLEVEEFSEIVEKLLEFAQTAVLGTKIVEQVQDLNIKSVEERIENALIKVK